jgi:Tfp pilus assembly protein PilV
MIKNKTKKYNLNDDRGFTIMETLVAIFILLLSITGPMVFSQSALRAAFQSRDQITAFYLAQDAIEFVKNKRDDNVLSGKTDSSGSNSWLYGLDNCITTGGDFGCTINTTTSLGNITKCNTQGQHPGCLGGSDDGIEDNKLRIDDDGFFVIDDSINNESKFARNIYIREVEGGTEAEIIVKVRWTSHDTIGVRDITIVEYMYNWANELGL